jgi:predicted permease
LPYPDADRLALVWTFDTAQNRRDGSSPQNTRDWVSRSTTVEQLALYMRPEFTTGTVLIGDRHVRVQIAMVESSFFDVLGVQARAGRTFVPSDIASGTGPVIVREDFLARFGLSTAAAIGHTLTVGGRPVTIAGVVAADVTLPTADTALWRVIDPMPPGAMVSRRVDAYVALIRVRETFTRDTAARELRAVATTLAVEHADTNRDFSVEVKSLRDEVVGSRLAAVLWMLLAAVGLVLLVAANNAAHLLLLRSERRRHEFAVRIALGAGRLRIIRQLTIEGLVMGVLAVVAGVAGGAGLLELLLSLAPPDVPRLDQATFDVSVALAGAASALIVSPVFAVLPALTTAGHADVVALRAGAGRSTPERRRLTRFLVAAELTLAVVLLVETGLVIRSVQALGSVDPGFDARSVLVGRIDLPETYTPGARIVQFHDELRARLETVSGIDAVAAMGDVFLRRNPDQKIVVEGRDQQVAPRLTVELVTPGFIDALGLTLQEGRALTPADHVTSGQVGHVVINRAMADAFWPGESAVGRRFWWWSPTVNTSADPGLRVAGVVSDFRRERLDEPPFPNAFVIMPMASMDLAIRTTGDPQAVMAKVHRVVREIDAGVALTGLAPAWNRFAGSMASRFFQVWLLGGFATLAIGLAVVGLFALLSQGVVSRRREIGIRLALGAQPAAVRRLIVRDGLLLTAQGLAVGLIAAWFAARLTRQLLFDVSPGDPLTFVWVSVGVFLVAAGATWLPAVRAGRLPVARIIQVE